MASGDFDEGIGKEVHHSVLYAGCAIPRPRSKPFVNIDSVGSDLNIFLAPVSKTVSRRNNCRHWVMWSSPP